jgi:outer membrane protein assembly factor BamB
MACWAATVALWLCLGVAGAADWPTWRGDVLRSGTSAETLPPRLEMCWEWELPAVQAAFPFESRLHFDTCHEVVSAAGRIVFGCPQDGTVRCLDAGTGEELWRFFTGGPVRLAPVLWQDRAIVGSDDGWLYCLDALTGNLVWRRRLAPEDRPDLRHLGSNRLISAWPVRGGPVLADGVVYAAAGVWPTMGIFVYALAADSGAVLWCNDRVNWLADVRIDHNMTRDMALTPCGYLALADDRLVVPNGRSHPAGFRRADGSLIYYVQGYRNGHCRVALSGPYAFVGKTGLVSLRDLREVASRWAQAGAAAPAGFDGAKVDLFEGPFLDYRSAPACDAFSVFADGRAYGLHQGVFYAYDMKRAALSEQTIEKPTGVQRPYRWDVPVLWRQGTAAQGQPGRTLIKAGDRLYGCAGTTLMALDLVGPDLRPGEVSWQVDLGQPAESLVASNGRLLVSTRQGRLLCFAAPVQGAAPRRWADSAVEPAPAGSWRAEAARLAALAGVREGTAVVRAGGIEAVLGLVQAPALDVVLVTTTAAEADAAQRALSQAGLLGRRATVLPPTAVLPPYLVSLMLLEAGGIPADLEGLWASIHPYGGTVAISINTPAALAERLRAAALPGAAVSSAEGLLLVRREGPLPGSAAWTHESADASRTHFSHDQRVRAPLGVLWYGEGPGYGFFKIHDYGLGHKPVVAGGRVVALQQCTGTLFAYDAYTGRVVWQQKLIDRGGAPRWLLDGSYEWSWTATGGPTPRYACADNAVYVAFAGACRVLDAGSGEETARWDFADLGREATPPAVKGIVVSEKQVVVLAGYTAEQAIEQGLWDGELLVAFARADGRRLWVRQAAERFNVKAVAVLADTLYCIDSISPVDTDRWRRRGAALSECESTVLALDAQSGQERWRKAFRAPFRVYGGSAWTAIMGRDDWLACAPEAGLVLCGREGLARSLRSTDGETVWEKSCGSQPYMLAAEIFMNQEGEVFGLADGVPRPGPKVFQRGGCNYAVAGEHLAFVRDYSAMWVDLDSGQRHYARNLRAGCSASLVAADGLLNAPNFSPGCMCNYPVQTSSAWVTMPGIEPWAGSAALPLSPPRGDNGIPKVSPEQAEALREQASPNLLTTVDEAEASGLGKWTFEAGPALAEAIRDGSALRLPTRIEGDGLALAPGVAGQCLTLTGSGRLAASVPAAARPRAALSLCAWIRPDPKQPYAPGFAGAVDCAQAYRICLINAEAPYAVHFGVQLNFGAWAAANSDKRVAAGQWTHVAGTFDGETGELRLFIQGVEVAKGSCPPGSLLREAQGPIQIGVRDGCSHFSGALDEVRGYRGALSAALVRELARPAAAPSAAEP